MLRGTQLVMIRMLISNSLLCELNTTQHCVDLDKQFSVAEVTVENVTRPGASGTHTM
jgi:hypothetical protein